MIFLLLNINCRENDIEATSKEKRTSIDIQKNNFANFYDLQWKEEYRGWEISKRDKELKCMKELRLPGFYSNNEHSGPVVEVKKGGFANCGLNRNETESIYIPKEIRFLRAECFFCSYYVKLFEIEEGSQLEVIEYISLHFIGYRIPNEVTRTTLILPSTITHIAEQGIYRCYEIVYCGWRILENVSQLTDTNITNWKTPMLILWVKKYLAN